ncbi:hypothetical protein Vretifemale_18754 [Volvox reticuliferus]|uniref:Uncharacterized protein n=1 Tax=Volvox reticuliferus TaxID=1737510 RepID=A0A8J4D1H4_9CHLO|nr:hypothetical protein Vretifemale_18754 [Volvox reticuliferus]
MPLQPPPRPCYGGHLAADQHSAAKMGSQSAVRAVEAAISLPSRPANPASDNVLTVGDVSSVPGAPTIGAPPRREGGGMASQGGVAGRVTAVVSEAAHSVGATIEGVAEGLTEAAAQTWSTAKTAGRRIGNAARHLAEDATTKGHGSKACEGVDNAEENGS